MIKFAVHKIGGLPDEFNKAVTMLNRVQTVWSLNLSNDVKKPDSHELRENISVIPPLDKCGVSGASFSIGVTSGKIEQSKKISYIDGPAKQAMISEYEWRSLKTYEPIEAFWALALSNIGFRTSLKRDCDEKNCLGYKDFEVENLLLTLLDLHICEVCKGSILSHYKYQLDEFYQLIECLKNPIRYNHVELFEKPYLPTLNRQVNALKKDPAFQKLGIIGILHFLENLVSFVEGLIECGARKESIVLLVKPYPYAHRSKVHSYFITHYPEIRIEYLDHLPPKDKIMKDLVEYCRDKSLSKKILVIEDGGYLVPYLHKNYPRELSFCVGAVEQTTKGLRRDQELTEFYFPILNVAKSDFKDNYESPLVGRSVVNSIQKILSEVHFSGKSALVVGFGAVGREVALSLEKIGMIVRVFDPKLEQVAAARVRGFDASDNPIQFIKGAKLIVGTTGSTSISKNILENMDSGTILASASSDRVEIDLTYLERISTSGYEYKPGLGTIYRRKKSSGGDDIYTLLADGFPINFYSGSGIPTTSIDPVLAQLLIGADYVARNHEQMAAGISEIMNKLIEEYNLIQDFSHEYYS